jgi:membrane protein implicated in regulation of membrane protease activity
MIFRPRGRGELPIPTHPYRDSALVNAGLAILLLLIAWFTGGDVLTAAFVAVGFFVVATTWNWWRFRQRLAAREAEEQASE